MILIDRDLILTLVGVIIVISVGELLFLSFIKKGKQFSKDGFFYNITSGIFLMMSFLTFAEEYFIACIFLLFCSGFFHTLSLIIFLKRKV